jgi:hypothetical protein
VEVGRHAQVDLPAERFQLRRQRHQRLDIAPRSDCRQQHAHETSPCRGLHKKTLDMFFEGTDRSGIDDHYDTAPAARDALCRAEEEATTIR